MWKLYCDFSLKETYIHCVQDKGISTGISETVKDSATVEWGKHGGIECIER